MMSYRCQTKQNFTSNSLYLIVSNSDQRILRRTAGPNWIK